MSSHSNIFNRNAQTKTSRIGLGLAALGRPGYINLGHAADLARGREVAAMEAHAHEVLDAAYAGGVRYFDAARSYGRSEAFLATWLISRGIKPGEVNVGSKWGYIYTANWTIDADKHEVKEHTLTNLRQQREETESLLGPYLNLYQIHSATLESGVLSNQPVLEELGRLRRTGVRIGLSLSGPEQAKTLRAAMAVEVNGGRLFDSVQATWNLLERSAGFALCEAHDVGMGVIIKEALANGRLTSRNDNPAFAAKRRAIEAEATRLSTSIDALALAGVLACPWVDVVLSGAASGDQLQSNLTATRVKWDDAAAEQLQFLIETPDEYWATRAALPWN